MLKFEIRLGDLSQRGRSSLRPAFTALLADKQHQAQNTETNSTAQRPLWNTLRYR